MIKTFPDKHTREVYVKGKSKRLAPDIIKRAIRRLEYIDLATCLNDLKVPPSNRLHALKVIEKGNTPYPSTISGESVSNLTKVMHTM